MLTLWQILQIALVLSPIPFIVFMGLRPKQNKRGEPRRINVPLVVISALALPLALVLFFVCIAIEQSRPQKRASIFS